MKGAANLQEKAQIDELKKRRDKIDRELAKLGA
jgi:hypothetical protein